MFSLFISDIDDELIGKLAGFLGLFFPLFGYLKIHIPSCVCVKERKYEILIDSIGLTYFLYRVRVYVVDQHLLGAVPIDIWYPTRSNFASAMKY